MMQKSLKAGLKKLEKQGKAAVIKELGQFHDMSVFVPMNLAKLTRGVRTVVVASLFFLEKKKDGAIKAQACTNGRTCVVTAEEELASPTVLIESAFMSCTRDTSKGRDAAADEPLEAFLHADNGKHIIMQFHRILAELMVCTTPQIYCKYITPNDMGELALFGKLQKTLDCMII